MALVKHCADNSEFLYLRNARSDGKTTAVSKKLQTPDAIIHKMPAVVNNSSFSVWISVHRKACYWSQSEQSCQQKRISKILHLRKEILFAAVKV